MYNCISYLQHTKFEFSTTRYTLLLKSKFLEFFNYYTQMIPLRGEKKYQHFLEFKLLREPIYNKEFNANDLIDYFLGFIIIRKLINNIAKI